MWLWVKTLFWLSRSQIPTNHFIFDHINDLISLLWSYLQFLHEGTNLKLYPTMSWLLTKTSIIMIYTVCYLNSVNTKWQHCWNCLHLWRLPVTSIVLMQNIQKLSYLRNAFTNTDWQTDWQPDTEICGEIVNFLTVYVIKLCYDNLLILVDVCMYVCVHCYYRYISQLYSAGDFCEEANKPRKVEVKLK